MCGGKQDKSYCKFLAESKGERILKICQHTPKLCLNVEWHVFIDSRCIVSKLNRIFEEVFDGWMLFFEPLLCTDHGTSLLSVHLTSTTNCCRQGWHTSLYQLFISHSLPLDNIRVMVIVWRLRGNIIRTALYWIVPERTFNVLSGTLRNQPISSLSLSLVSSLFCGIAVVIPVKWMCEKCCLVAT